MTRTALLLALTLVFQMSRPLFPPNVSTFVVGSLVNAALMIAAGTLGIAGAVLISVIAPIIAFLQQHIKFIWMVPIVMIGNVIIVIVFGLLFKKNQWVAMISGAVLKFVFLWFAIVQLALPLVGMKGPAANAIIFSFSWPQLVTAILGGILAITVIKALDGIVKKK